MHAFVTSCLSFIFMISLVVGIHEFGHFWVARRCGVRILKFSIGFGPALLRWHDRHRTEFVIGCIPLGGYVKMLDARAKDTPTVLQAYTFDGQSPWRRAAILAAGPMANFILAIGLFWGVFMMGVELHAPVVESLVPHSPVTYTSLKIGDEIIAVDGHTTSSWQSLMAALGSHMGDEEALLLTVRSPQQDKAHDISVQLTRWPKDMAPEMLLEAIGIGLVPEALPAVIGVLQPDSPAARAGLQVGDTIAAVNGQPVTWAQLVQILHDHTGGSLALSVHRGKKVLDITAVPAMVVDLAGIPRGRLGIGMDMRMLPKTHAYTVHYYSPLAALKEAVEKTTWYSYLTLEAIGKMVTGTASLDNLSGPVMMAQGAGEMARTSVAHYVGFLALVSIGLGIFNLLPIPMLDGGGLVYCLIEILRGKPLSIKAQEIGLIFGVILLFVMIALGFYNDCMRLLAF